MSRERTTPKDSNDEAIIGHLNRLHEKAIYYGDGIPMIRLEAVRLAMPEFMDELGILCRTVCKTPESVEAVQKIQARTNKRNESNIPKKRGRPKRLAE